MWYDEAQKVSVEGIGDSGEGKVVMRIKRKERLTMIMKGRRKATRGERERGVRRYWEEGIDRREKER